MQEYTRLATSWSLFYAAKNDVVENSGSERLVPLAGAPNSMEQKCFNDVILSKLLLCILNIILLKNIVQDFGKDGFEDQLNLKFGINNLQIRCRN